MALLRPFFNALRLPAISRCSSNLTSTTVDISWRRLLGNPVITPAWFSQTHSSFHHLCLNSATPAILTQMTDFLHNQSINNCQVRTVTKYSRQNGTRKTVKAVLKRFYRLDWGGWIRTRSGRHKHLWRKSPALRRRLRQHVFVNSTQSWMLDKMVNKYWKKPKHYVDDPYEPYHTREEYYITRKRPLPSS